MSLYLLHCIIQIIVAMKSLYLPFALWVFSILSTLSLAGQGFTEHTQTFAATYYGAAVWADYDKDGHLDFFVNGWRVGTGGVSLPSAYLYRNNGNGTFSEVTTTIQPLGASTAAWGDFNNDGYPDLAIAGNAGSSVYATRIYRNNGNGTFTDIQAPLMPLITPSIAWGDLNNDGFLDLVIVGGDNGGNGQSKIYLNNKNEGFTEIASSLVQLTNGAVAIADLNKDGLMDIVIAGRLGSFNYVTKVYLNQGGAVFAEMPLTLEASRYSAIAIADYNNDGYPDLLIAGSNNNDILHTRLYKNVAGTNFVWVPAAFTGTIQGSVAWGDFNNDGLYDIAITGSNVSTGATRVTELYLNEGNDVFTKYNGFSFPGLRRSTAYWGDYNNDGKLDLLATGYRNVSDYITKIYTNAFSNTNTPPSVPAGLTALVTGGNASLSWSAATDGQTPSESLTYNISVGSSPGASDIVNPISNLSSGRLFIPKTGNTSNNTFALLQGLTEGTYYWRVQSVDAGFEGSAFSEENVFTISDLLTATFLVRSGGQPLEGATVQIGSETQQTNASGTVVFNLNNGSYSYTVSHPFHATQNGNFTIADQSISVTIDLVQLPVFQLAFQLTDPEGPVENAIISIAGQQLMTNNLGTATINVLEGNYTYYIYSPNHNQVLDEVQVNSNMNIGIMLTPIALQTLPHTETFASPSQPVHWFNFDESGNGYRWYFAGGRAIINSDTAGPGVNVHASLISPPLQISGLSGSVKLRIRHFFDQTGINNRARIHYATDEGNWIQIAEFTSDIGTINNFVWTELLVEGLTGSASSMKFKFEYNDGGAWSEVWMIDELQFSHFNLEPYEMTTVSINKPTLAQTPVRHFPPFVFGAKGKNTGANTLQGLFLDVSENQTTIAISSPVPFFPAGYEYQFSASPAFQPNNPGAYHFLHRFIAEGVSLPALHNEVLLSIAVTDTVFATESGLLVAGVGGSAAITFGNLFHLTQADQLRSFTIGWPEITDNLTFTASLFRINMADTSIVAEVFTTPELNRNPSDSWQFTTYALNTTFDLPAGYYALMVNQTGNTSIRVGYDGESGGLFWRRTEQKLSPFQNTQWGNIALRMNVCGLYTTLNERKPALFEAYPNPAQNQLQLNYSGKQNTLIQIYDTKGKLRLEKTIVPGSNTLDLSSLSAGLYVLQAEGFSQKVIVQP